MNQAIDLAPLELLQRRLRALAGPHAAVACRRTTSGDVRTLAPEEQAAVHQAVASRQIEFAAGRQAARDAMRRLGWRAMPVPVNQDRSPRWPAGLVGSISHCRDACVAVLAPADRCQAVGVDVEPDQGIPSDLWPTICTPAELRQVSDMPEAVRAGWVTRVFCAKEAYYKWVYPRLQCLLDFQDVEIVQVSTRADARFEVHPRQEQVRRLTPRGLCGSLLICEGLVTALIVS